MRQSAFRSTWSPNKRPYIKFAPDSYVSFQGEASTIACGECQRRINYNDYITSMNSSCAVDAAPGQATINMTIPDNDVNDFYSDGQFLLVPMMEVEIYSKGYYLIGGIPQYYRTFWGMITQVSRNWSNGVTNVVISCKDMLRWWELTNVTINPAYTQNFGSSAGQYQLFQNQFAGQNPYTVMIQLARDAMGDFLITTGSLTSVTPEKGSESPAIASYSKDIMAYWQLRFSNISANLVLYGASGTAYSLSGQDGTLSPNAIADEIFKTEYERLKQNASSQLFFSSPREQAVAKIEVPRAGDVEFFQAEVQSKLQLAFQARDQIGYEFYCDSSGDIIFKPPFFNLNVLPNKPVSWIQDFEIIDDSIVDSETEVVTHVTSSGNAFGGVTDWGINDEFTTPKTGVYDFHLLRRYGWRRADLSVEWAGNPRKLFYHLLDWMDRLNAKRQYGTVTIPMRPEIRVGFPVWIPKYDSFFYIQGVSHSYTPSGQATTTLTLTAKRSKFIAPKNIGSLKASISPKTEQRNTRTMETYGSTGQVIGKIQEPTYEITFPGSQGASSGTSEMSSTAGDPGIIRDPKTGRLLGYPNVVMVYRSAVDQQNLMKVIQSLGKKENKEPRQQENKKEEPPKFTYEEMVNRVYKDFYNKDKSLLINRARAHRYESGMSNAGSYDYAHDETRSIKELALIPIDSCIWGSGTDGGPAEISASETMIGLISKGSNNYGADKAFIGDEAIKMNKQLETLKSDKLNLERKIKILRVNQRAAKIKYQEYQKSLPDGLFSGDFDNFQKLSTVDKSSPYNVLVSVTKELEDALTSLQLLNDNINSTTIIAKAVTSSSLKPGNSSILPNLNILVRPVSDEFGFEVIGHYRYGRGTFLDRGKLQIQGESGDVANQISLQFAPTAGILTDSPSISGMDPQVSDFASQFERMQPDDYATGGSFSGTLSRDKIDSWDQTNENTYTSLINENKGTGVYIEADITRKAKTLAELVPTVDLGSFSQGFNTNCSCALSKANWYTLLPQSLIQNVMRASLPAGQVEPLKPLSEIEASDRVFQLQIEKDRFINTGAGIIPTATDSIESLSVESAVSSTVTSTNSNVSTDFFGMLSKYLVDLFNEQYQSYNSIREEKYTGSTKNVYTDIISTQEQDNILGDPDSDLFKLASGGDVASFEKLQQQVQSGFKFSSTTKQAYENLKEEYEKAKSTNLGTKPEDGQKQPPAPNFGNLNPTNVNTTNGNFVFRTDFTGQFGSGER